MIRPGVREPVLRRTAQPDDADVDAPVHAAGQRVFAAARESDLRPGALLCLVQLVSSASSAHIDALDARPGRRPDRHVARCRMDRRARGLVCAAIAWAHTHPAEGLTRRLVDASRVRIPAPVRSRPRWSRRIPTRIAHGIGHDHAWVFMDSIGNKAVNPKLAASAPNATDRYHRAASRWPPSSRSGSSTSRTHANSGSTSSAFLYCTLAPAVFPSVSSVRPSHA